MRTLLLAAALLGPLLPARAGAQDIHIFHRIPEIEARLRDEPFRIHDWRGSRRPEDRTQRVVMSFADSTVIAVKWANAPLNGSAFNNEPRYEAAAYELQKLFLDEDEYVVPPTLLRAVPLERVREHMPDARATFGEAPGSVLVALQYWLNAVTPDRFWDRERARRDTVYARHIGNMNALTVAIRHSDANVGNFLVSNTPPHARVFSVDNGVAFASPESNRGFEWRDLQVERMSRRTVERLAGITRADLERALGVLAEFEIRDGELVRVEPGPNMAPGRGVRRSDTRIQLGLTTPEIRDVERRIQALVRQTNGRRFELIGSAP